jgi:hypothetical protein
MASIIESQSAGGQKQSQIGGIDADMLGICS